MKPSLYNKYTCAYVISNVKHILHILLSVVLLSVGSTTSTWAQEGASQPADTTGTQRETVHLKGRVTDENQHPLPFASVRVEGQMVGTTTNLEGQYTISFTSADTVRIVYSMMGFQQRRRTLTRPSGQLTLNIVMREAGNQMQEVTVKEVQTQMGATQTLNLRDIKRMPSTTGNAVEELVATQAGVSSHNELSSQYNVRGGSFDENCVYINGVEVYRPLLISSGQQEGLSVINSDMVERVDFSSGGFEAKYGDKMSSVLDITYRRPERWEASTQLSLLGANAYAGYGNSKFSFSNSVRYKTIQYLLGSMQTEAEYRPDFVDYQAFLSYRPTQRWSFDLIGYFSQNNYNFVPHNRETSFGTLQAVRTFKVYFDGQEQDLFKTLFGTAKIGFKINKYQKLSLAYSAFTTRERETYDIQGQYWLDDTQTQVQLGVGTYINHARNLLNSGSQTLKLNYEWKRYNHTLMAGFGYRHESIDENSREWESRDSSGYNIPHSGNSLHYIYNLKSKNKVSSDHVELFVQDTWRHESAAGIINLNYGLRLSHWNWNSEWLCSPRVCAGYVPERNENLTFRLSTGLYYQRPFYKELRDTITEHYNTRVELNRGIRSQGSYQLLLGGEYKFRLMDRPFKFSAETYYKAQWNINPYNVDNVKIVYYGRNCASGYVVGADFKVYGEFVPGTDSWVSFGIMKAEMNMNGKKIPQPTDQRWNLNMFFSDYFPNTTRWKFSLKANFSDGLPFGAPHTGLERHSFRAPAYKRVDVGMNFRALKNEDHHMRRNAVRNIWIGLDCFNIFDFQNVSGYYWVNDVEGHQFAVPNYLTGRMVNARVLIEF